MSPMGRPPKFTSDMMLDAARGVLVASGPAGLSVSAVARATGAPSGSVYHRFSSRDQLAASLWMRTVERFDGEVVSYVAARGEPLEVAVAAAHRVIDWSVQNPDDAFVLTMFRREDLLEGTEPDLAGRATELGRAQQSSIHALALRLHLPADLVSLAVAGIPMAAVRQHVARRAPIPSWTPGAVERAVRALLSVEPLQEQRHESTRPS